MNLPIDVKPNTAPPMFVWQQTVDTPNGKQTVSHEGFAPVAMEQALVLLIKEVNRLARINAELHQEVNKLNAENANMVFKLEEFTNDLEAKIKAQTPAPQVPVKGGKGR